MRHRLGAGMGAAAGARLLEAACQESTARKYISSWELFEQFCSRARLRALPAEPATVVRYLGLVRELGTVAARSLGNRLAPIKTVHLLAGYESPTDDYLVRQAKRGYRRCHTAAVGARPERRAPLPAAAVNAFLDLWPVADSSLRHKIAGTALACLLFNRPGAASHMRAADVFPSRNGLEVQVPDYKMAVLKDGDRIAYTVPVAAGGWPADRVLRIIRAHWRAHMTAGRPRNERLFAPAGTVRPLAARVVTRWMRDLMALSPVRAPLGTKWTGHSIRAGAASEAHAIGLRDALVQQLMGLSAVQTAYRYYIDATWAPSGAAWSWFGRYVPRARPHLRQDGTTPPSPTRLRPLSPLPGQGC